MRGVKVNKEKVKQENHDEWIKAIKDDFKVSDSFNECVHHQFLSSVRDKDWDTTVFSEHMVTHPDCPQSPLVPAEQCVRTPLRPVSLFALVQVKLFFSLSQRGRKKERKNTTVQKIRCNNVKSTSTGRCARSGVFGRKRRKYSQNESAPLSMDTKQEAERDRERKSSLLRVCPHHGSIQQQESLKPAEEAAEWRREVRRRNFFTAGFDEDAAELQSLQDALFFTAPSPLSLSTLYSSPSFAPPVPPPPLSPVSDGTDKPLFGHPIIKNALFFKFLQ